MIVRASAQRGGLRRVTLHLRQHRDMVGVGQAHAWRFKPMSPGSSPPPASLAGA